jgi:hypothetical protein
MGQTILESKGRLRAAFLLQRSFLLNRKHPYDQYSGKKEHAAYRPTHRVDRIFVARVVQ